MIMDDFFDSLRLPSDDEIKEETKREKIRAALVGHDVTNASRKKMSQSQLNRFSNESEKQKRSESAKKQYKDPQQIKILSDIGKNLMNDPKRKELQSKVMSKLWEDDEFIAIRKACAQQQMSNPETVPNYKGEVIGTNYKTQEKIYLKGSKEMIAAGFSPQLISHCINGIRKTHKGYTWRREE